MTNLIILFDAIAYSVGLLNLFLILLLYVRDRDILYLREFLLMLSFSAIVVTHSLMAANGGQLPAGFSPAGNILAYCGTSGLIFTLPWYVHQLEPVGHMALKNRCFLLIAGLTLLANIVGSLLTALGINQANPAINFLTLGLCIATTVYTISLGILGKITHHRTRETMAPAKQQGSNETTKTTMRMGLVTLLLLPALIYLDMADLPIAGWPELKGLHIVPIIYVVWSSLLMNLRVHTLLAPLPGPDGYTVETVGTFSNEFQLSPRECEVMEQLIQGHTYDQIADRLCISLSTAKTHIGRIYRKAGVTNKVELIHSLQGSAGRAIPITSPSPKKSLTSL